MSFIFKTKEKFLGWFFQKEKKRKNVENISLVFHRWKHFLTSWWCVDKR
jgi:hypothetical protein